ncbi:glycosyl hydrolase family 98 [Deinococcus aerius]|uniref:Glycosyl hydrolase family 98 n=1 Tax=Deinococcus aerius TaxID=200253 RepID=A0A2I9CW63_9DEIO|nr:hypothetical protein [Deinococcus aerius]GBF06213.1 glycosyl hydrolase family 98 [Deinococcus aerius]
MKMTPTSFPSSRLGLVLVAALVLGTSAQQSPTDLTYDGPITIRKGGTYRGNWRSLDPNKPAIDIATREPVIIEYSNVEGRGTLIHSAFDRANVTIRNTRGVALNPNLPASAKRAPGRFLNMEEFESAVVENNELIGTSGMYFRKYVGDPERGQTIKVLRNRALNIDGRYSDGEDQFSSTGYKLVQFVQFNDIKDIQGAEVAWNEVINEPGKSRVEEVINMYGSRGTASSRISIHDNYIQGAYPVHPGTDKYAGGGLMMGDGGSKTKEGAGGYIIAYRNQIVSTSNQGIAIASGNNIEVFENRVISSGYLPNGTPIAAQNVGMYVWDTAGNKQHGTFYNNLMRDNLVGWARPLKSPTAQNPLWLPDCATTTSGQSRCTGNRVLPGPITLQMERQEYERWQDKLRDADIVVGLKQNR